MTVREYVILPQIKEYSWCSGCWVYASGLSDRSISEKYSWAVLKAWSETVSAGAHILIPEGQVPVDRDTTADQKVGFWHSVVQCT